MATEDEKSRYPYFSARNWWDLRRKFQEGYPPKVSVGYLQPVLGISHEITAKRIISQLELIGLIEEDGTPTDLAKKEWPFDDSYADVCKKIIEKVYPEELRAAFTSPDPSQENNRIRWFLNSGSTRNKTIASGMARFYILLLKADPSEQEQAPKRKPREAKVIVKKEPSKGKKKPTRTDEGEAKQRRLLPFEPALRIDVQIHIPKDATSEQIDQIFKSMAEHIYKIKK